MKAAFSLASLCAAPMMERFPERSRKSLRSEPPMAAASIEQDSACAPKRFSKSSLSPASALSIAPIVANRS